MTMRIAGLVACFMVVSQMVMASAPGQSLRPELRPGSAKLKVVATVPLAHAMLRPVPRPGSKPIPAPIVAQKPERVVLASAGAAVRVSIRPDVRPANLRRRNVVQASVRSQPATPVATSKRGSVCGDRTIRGQTMSAIPGRLKGCGVSNPVKVTSIDGVTLSMPSTMNCSTAKALKRWINRSAKPAVGRLGGGVKSLKVVAHYACRTRNNQPGEKISEHGRGNAIDIAAIKLNNGVSLTVLKGWRDRVQGPILKKMHRGACGPFGTVLGPDANRYHQDHFHFDVAQHRGGSYCR